MIFFFELVFLKPMNLLPHNKIIKGIHYLPTFIFLIFPNKNRYKIIKLDCRVFFFLLNTHDFKSIIMVVFDYFEDVLEGFEYLIALGSIVGLFGLMIGIIFLIWGGQRVRNKMIGVIISSFVLLAVCGLDTGIKYFRIF